VLEWFDADADAAARGDAASLVPCDRTPRFFGALPAVPKPVNLHFNVATATPPLATQPSDPRRLNLLFSGDAAG
jgi:hypothetical protein